MGATELVLIGIAVLVVAAGVVLVMRRRRSPRPTVTDHRTHRPHDAAVLEAKGLAEAHRHQHQGGPYGF